MRRPAPSRASARASARRERAARATSAVPRSDVAALVACALALGVALEPARALEANERESAFVSGLLAKSDSMREARKKERLDDYNRKNFGDYLAWQQGDKALADPSTLSENDRAIAAYLKSIERS